MQAAVPVPRTARGGVPQVGANAEEGHIPDLLARWMVEFSEAAELPWESTTVCCLQGAMPTALSRKPFSGLLEEASPGGAMPPSSRVLGQVVHERWHLLWSFPRRCEGQPFMRSTTSGTLLQSCLLKACLPRGRLHALEEHPRTSKRNPLLFQYPSSALYWQSLTSHQLAKDCLQVQLLPQSRQKEGQVWKLKGRKLTTGTIYKDESPWTVFSDKFLNYVQFMVMIASPHPTLFSNFFSPF